MMLGTGMMKQQQWRYDDDDDNEDEDDGIIRFHENKATYPDYDELSVTI